MLEPDALARLIRSGGHTSTWSSPTRRSGRGEFDPFPVDGSIRIMGFMNVILRFEPLESDRPCNVIRLAPNSYAYGTGRSGDVAGRGDDDAAATPRAVRARRPRRVSLLAAASIAVLGVGAVSLASGPTSGAELTGVEITTEAVAAP